MQKVLLAAALMLAALPAAAQEGAGAAPLAAPPCHVGQLEAHHPQAADRLQREPADGREEALEPAGQQPGERLLEDNAVAASALEDSSRVRWMMYAGLALMLNMQVGEVIFGGVGSGRCSPCCVWPSG